MPLSASQKRYLRGVAHALHPLVQVGQKGITDGVQAELDSALAHHELVKVRLAGERDERAAAIEALRQATGAELVQAVGKTACFYRRNPERAQFSLPR